MIEVLFFNNGNTAYLKDGEQVSELQKAWFELYINFLVEKGVDPIDCVYRFQNGDVATVFKTEDGYNWHLKKSDNNP